MASRKICMIMVGAASLNQTPLDWEQNLSHILQAIEKARKASVRVLCCPELCITGYGCEDRFLSASTCKIAFSILERIVPYTKDIAVAVGLPILFRDGLYNVACLIVNETILGFVPKQHLAGSGLHYEPRWFKAWPSNVCSEIVLNEKVYPFGDLVFDLGGIRIGFEICEDAWASSRTGVGLASRGVDLILNPSASHFAFGKSEVRKRFVREGARAFHAAYIYANLLGNEAGRIIYDGDTIIAAGEHLLALGPRFSFQDVVLSTALIDIQLLHIQRASVVSYPTVVHNMIGIVPFPFPFIDCESQQIAEIYNHDVDMRGVVGSNQESKTPWEGSDFIKEEEFSRVVALGLYDYLRKSKAQGFVLNLSGGADSTACACLIHLMVHLGCQELGLEAFVEKLSDIQGLKDIQSQRECLQKILYCLYQNTVNNSTATQNAAEEIAKTLNVPLAILPIDDLVSGYSQLIQPFIGRELSWEEDDIALQNIQSRVRGPSAWLLANLRKSILLSTSNRSEASVGYTTLDGDTTGGLCPLGGIDKVFILQWLKWMERKGGAGIPAIPSLKAVTLQAPTAELRPLTAFQNDEMDLMPYDKLDFIERYFVRDRRSPVEILPLLQYRYPNEPLEKLAKYIELFFTRWAQTQWKRERYAPSFHLDDESVDPKTWCRSPILSGGFELEIQALWEAVKVP